MRNTQKGMATVLILLFVGMALGASVLGANYYVKGMQEQQTTTLAATQAQMRAWQGLSIAQAVFANMTPAQLQVLANTTATAPQNITLNGVNNIALQVTAALPTVNPSQFNITVTGSAASGTPLAASSRLAASIIITPATPPTPPRLLSGVSIEGNLKMSGDIKIFEGDINNFEIIVKGDVDLKSNSIQNSNVIRATGNINVESSSSYGLLHSNKNVTMSGSTSADAVLAKGSIFKNTSGKIIYAATDNNLTVSNSGTIHDLLVGGTLDITTKSPEAVSSTKGYAAHVFDPVKDGFTIQTLADFDTTNKYDNTAGKPKYDKVKNPIKNLTWGITTDAISVVSSLIVNLPAVEISSDAPFNAYDYKTLANYAFTYDDRKIKVQIKRVNHIDDGDYFLCNGTKIDLKEDCSTPANKNNTLAIAKNLITYNSSDNTWTLQATDINAKTMAPGVAWFEGNLLVKNGTYYNVFIATLTLKSAQSKIYSPNYAAYSGKQAGETYAPLGYCNQTDYAFKPRQLCEMNTENTWDSDIDGGIGNYSVMAGSLGKDGNYQGGNIAFLNENEIFGSVWAGNLYGTDADYGGSVILHGYIKAQARGDTSSNIIKNSTTIDLKKLPASFRPGTGVIKPGTPGSVATPPQIRWVRYL